MAHRKRVKKHRRGGIRGIKSNFITEFAMLILGNALGKMAITHLQAIPFFAPYKWGPPAVVSAGGFFLAKKMPHLKAIGSGLVVAGGTSLIGSFVPSLGISEIPNSLGGGEESLNGILRPSMGAMRNVKSGMNGVSFTHGGDPELVERYGEEG